MGLTTLACNGRLKRYWGEAVQVALREECQHRVALDHRGVDRIRMDRVHSDPELTQLEGKRVGQPNQAMLGRRVVAVAGVALTPANELTMTIDPPLPASIIARHGRPHGAPGTRQVDADDGVPLLFGQLPQSAPAQHPGVGNRANCSTHSATTCCSAAPSRMSTWRARILWPVASTARTVSSRSSGVAPG